MEILGKIFLENYEEVNFKVVNFALKRSFTNKLEIANEFNIDC